MCSVLGNFQNAVSCFKHNYKSKQTLAHNSVGNVNPSSINSINLAIIYRGKKKTGIRYYTKHVGRSSIRRKKSPSLINFIVLLGFSWFFSISIAFSWLRVLRAKVVIGVLELCKTFTQNYRPPDKFRVDRSCAELWVS